MTTLYDRLIAVFALVLFALFLGIIFWQVAEWDLRIALTLAVAMAAYDFWLGALRPGPRDHAAPHPAPDDHSHQHDGI